MATTYLDSGDTGFKISNNGTTVFGQTGDEQIIIEAGVTGIVTDQNVERVDLAGAAADFTYAQAGNQMQVYSGGNLVATIPLQGDTDGTQVVFSDGSVSAVLTAGVMTLGGATVSATAGAVVPTTIDTSITTDATLTPPTPDAASLSIADVTVAEDGGVATFTVTLSTAPAAGESVTVDYATADGTATAGTDYTAASGTLTFGPGVTTQTITVPITDDTDVDGSEAFTVTLSNVAGTVGTDAATISDASATGTITDNDVASVPGETYTLTNSFNQSTGGIDNLVGSDNDDLIIASVSSTASNSTYSVGDRIDGGAGNDTLNVSMNADSDSVDVTNVEMIEVRNTSATAYEFDATSISGANTITAYKSKGNLKITGVNDLSTKIGVFGTDKDAYVGFASTATSGTEDAMTFTLDTVGTSTTNVNLYTENVEVFNLVSNGTAINYLGVVAADQNNNIATIAGAEVLTTLNISGSADVRIATALDSAVTKVDGSTATGDIRLVMESNISDITTGIGDDRIDMGVAGNLTTADTVDGGLGTDSIVIADGYSTALTKVTNIEILRTADTANGTTDAYDMSAIESLTEVIIADGTGNGTDLDNVSVSNGEGKLTSVVDFASNITYTAKDNKASLTFKLDNSETVAKTDGIDISGTTTIDSVETLTIDSVGGMLTADNTNARTGLNANSITIADGTQIATLNVTGDTDVEITASAETGIATVDASAHTGNVALTIDNSKTKSITMGAGNDLVDLGTTDAKTAVVMGAGNDIVSLQFADLKTTDSLAGGDGVDTLVISDNMDVGTLAKSATLAAVSSFENVQMADNTTLTLSDSAVSSLGGNSVNVTRAATGANAVTVDAAAVTQATSTVTVDGSNVTASTATLTYTGSNAIDNFTGTLGNDTVTIDQSVLKSTDSFNGAAGADTFNLVAVNSSATAAMNVTADQLTNVKSFATITIDDDGTNSGNKIGIVLDDNFVDNNAASNALAVGAVAASAEKTTIDASAVTSDVTLTITGGTVADTLKGGAGADEINGLTGNDTLTGGAGKDDFNFTSHGASNADTIADMDFGTNTGTANVDQIDLSNFVKVANMTGTFDAIAYESAGAAEADVYVLNNATYATADLADAAVNVLAANNTDSIVIWADSFNTVHVGWDSDAGAEGSTLVDVASLTGVTIAGLSSVLDLDDFIIG